MPYLCMLRMFPSSRHIFRPLSPLSCHITCNYLCFVLPGWEAVTHLCNLPTPSSFLWTQHCFQFLPPVIYCILISPGTDLFTPPLQETDIREFLFSLVFVLSIYCLFFLPHTAFSIIITSLPITSLPKYFHTNYSVQKPPSPYLLISVVAVPTISCL